MNKYKYMARRKFLHLFPLHTVYHYLLNGRWLFYSLGSSNLFLENLAPEQHNNKGNLTSQKIQTLDFTFQAIYTYS